MLFNILYTNRCQRLGLTCLAYLWRRDQSEILDEMIRYRLDAIIIKVAAMGLDTRHLGMHLYEIQPIMHRLVYSHTFIHAKKI